MKSYTEETSAMARDIFSHLMERNGRKLLQTVDFVQREKILEIFLDVVELNYLRIAPSGEVIKILYCIVLFLNFPPHTFQRCGLR